MIDADFEDYIYDSIKYFVLIISAAEIARETSKKELVFLSKIIESLNATRFFLIVQ